MKRRRFLSTSAAAAPAALVPQAAAQPAAQTPARPKEAEAGGTGSTSYEVTPVIERPQPGKPHRGKIFAAFQPHCDDIPIFAAGTILKMIDEGYTGYLITMSDDSAAGTGDTYGEIVLKNENDTREVAKRLGCKDALFLNYPNHNMDAWPIIEMRARLVYIFRALKIDTVLVYDPSALYERNPDHYVTARAVEWAAATAGSKWDYPEHLLGGLTPHAPKERYYFARGPQLVNRIVDISRYIDQKVYVNMANVTQGPAGDTGARLRQKLAKEGKRLPLLGNTDDAANRAYTKQFALSRDRTRAQAHGLEYAEFFHYIGPDESEVEDYIRQNAVAL